MARDSQFPAFAPGALIALVLGAVGIFAVHKIPLQDARPAVKPVPLSLHRAQDIQDIEARLWDDPFDAVARARLANPILDSLTLHQGPSVLLTAGSFARVLVLGVLVTGAPYAEDIEVRRRARYAVLAGLHRAGFVPDNPEHVGFFAESQADAGSEIVVHESLSGDNSVAASQGADAVLLLWLDQDAFRSDPLAHFSKLVVQVAPQSSNVFAAMIGPSDSDGLRAMARELSACSGKPQCPAGIDSVRRITVYSSSATAKGDWVLDSPDPQCQLSSPTESNPSDAIARTFYQWSNQKIEVYRTVANDCVVSSYLFKELTKRGVDTRSEITLIAERDSLYARLMGKYFGGCFSGASVGRSLSSSTSYENHPTCFTYLRGLDGLSSPASRFAAATQTSSPDTTDTTTTTTTSSPSAASDTASGARQLDYVRRLAGQVAEQMQTKHCSDVRAKKADCTQAIGILGTDVYDKLLLLQVLRGSFPRAVFFTTDLDALLLDPRQLKWTRHLIIGSSYGLALRPELQADIPPFRDTYQTSIYLATMFAGHNEFSPRGNGLGHTPLVDQWSSLPRIFAVGRSEAFDLTYLGPKPTRPGCKALLECGEVYPPPVAAFWGNRSPLSGLKVGLCAIGTVLLGIWLSHVRRPSRGPRTAAYACKFPGTPKSIGIVVAATATFLAVISFAWPGVADWAARQETPVPLFGGASIWAALIVELLAMVAVVALTVRGQRQLDRNSVEICRQHSLPRCAEILVEHRAAELTRLGRRATLCELLWLPIHSLSSVETEPTNDELSPVEHLMARYLYRGQWIGRFSRVSVATLAVTMALYAIDLEVGTSYIELGILAPSGHDLRMVARIVSPLSMLFIEFLVIWVADAMLLSRVFTLELLAKRPAWPKQSIQRTQKECALSEGPATTWLNLQLVADRTSCVVDFVWYPSLVIAAMFIAAFTVEFGPFSFADNPISLIVGTGFVVAAAALLRRAAESLRKHSIAWLEDYRSRVLHLAEVGEPEGEQLDHLIARAVALDDGAFAPYSQQPLVKALIIPAATYATNSLPQYFTSLGF